MLIPVILSGDAGSQLWPVSRGAHPKPFIRLAYGGSLPRRTFCRAARIADVSDVMTVTNRKYYFLNKDEYAAAPVTRKHVFLLEPCARNTAPATAMAASYITANYGPATEMLVLPADHLIENEERWKLLGALPGTQCW